jgi:hypothetical protein
VRIFSGAEFIGMISHSPTVTTRLRDLHDQAIATTVTRSAHYAFGLLEPTLADYAVRT